MEQKHIIVACGTGGVTSRNIAMKIEKYLKGKGVDCKIDTCKVVEVRSKAESLKPDLIASAQRWRLPRKCCARWPIPAM